MSNFALRMDAGDCKHYILLTEQDVFGGQHSDEIDALFDTFDAAQTACLKLQRMFDLPAGEIDIVTVEGVKS